jgi:drug/metabolite transporter (DMT)-like permease
MNAIPEIRTSQRFAIVLSLLAVVATAIAVTVGSRVEDGLGSAAAATALLVIWCATGFGAAMAAVVDAWVRPEGERLGLATTIAATVFALLALVVVAGVVASVADFAATSDAAGSNAKK